MAIPRKYLNHLNLTHQPEGNEERYEVLKDIMKNGTFLPKTVEYKDIDESFKKWVEEKLKVSYNNKELPTMVLYSNQRFTEYSQSWKFTDENKNLILNFKTVLRENNPEYGSIQNKLWNIPGNRFYLMKKQIVLDDNGSESLLVLKMRQPMAVDFNYKVTVYTTNFETINEFNRLVNDRFKACQDYIFPNGHPMPMKLDSISDKSSYQIDDRQFYSQVYNIKVMGYVITEDDYRTEEHPLKIGAQFHNVLVKNTADVEVEEYENPCNMPGTEDKYYYKPVNVIINFPENCKRAISFVMDENFVAYDVKTENIKSSGLTINEDEMILPYTIKEGSEIIININKIYSNKSAKISFIGYNPDVAYSKDKDNPEIDADATQNGETIIVKEDD